MSHSWPRIPVSCLRTMACLTTVCYAPYARNADHFANVVSGMRVIFACLCVGAPPSRMIPAHTQPSDLQPNHAVLPSQQAPSSANGERQISDAAYEGEYSGSDVEVVASWIRDVTGEALTEPLDDAMRSGVVLCNLVNALRPGTIPKVSHSKMPFPIRENIKAFCDACRAFG